MSDWGIQSRIFDEIKATVAKKNLCEESEAQTRYDVIDQMIKKIFGWKSGQVTVEEKQGGTRKGYIDYVLRSGEVTLIIEAKRIGASFPTPSLVKSLKLNGSVLSTGEISEAIKQVLDYAKTKPAQIVMVTNGRCWCFFDLFSKKLEGKKAHLLFPFDNPGDAEELFNFFNEDSISKNGVAKFSDVITILPDRKILSTVRDSELRMDRNNIADYVSPALDNALYADSILNNAKYLKYCFISTASRIKFDSVLEMNLVDTKPQSMADAKKIKSSKKHVPFENIFKQETSSHSPPVTVILAPVGSGKSTYLKHFELVTGSMILKDNNALWIYIDFESMGKEDNPRRFLYDQLKKYLGENNVAKKTDYENAIGPAYENEIQSLMNGPLAPIANKKDDVDKKISELIMKDFELTEPYVDKVLSYLSKNRLCIIILDNIDLYEDEQLETSVFSEGLALGKRVYCNVIISLRDSTYIKHKNDSIFDAFQLKTFWLDAPPFKEVLSKRLEFSKILLKNKSAHIPLENGAKVDVKDLSDFFQIVQSSILNGDAGTFIEDMAGINIRKGLKLVTNFLTSGHINADLAIKTYLAGDVYTFPFHEIFKGSILGYWMYYKEARCDCLNIFDSGLNSKNLRLLRFFILSFLYLNSRSVKSIHVSVEKCLELFSHLEANASQIISVLTDLSKADLIKDQESKVISQTSTIYLTRTGGYCFRILSGKMVYMESCLYDTFIDDETVWKQISDLTFLIEKEKYTLKKLDFRKQRLTIFYNHLKKLEGTSLSLIGKSVNLAYMDKIIEMIKEDMSYATRSANELARFKNR